MKPGLPTLLVFTFGCFASFAQTEKFDIVTYRAPSGWKKDDSKDFAVSFSTVDQVAATWCQLAIYRSVASSGVPANDFTNEWSALVTKMYEGTTQPVPAVGAENGWTINSGASTFRWQNKDSKVLLVNASGFGATVSVVVTMNDDRYLKDVDNFLQSIDLEKPAQPAQPGVAAPAVQTQQLSQPPQPPSQATSSSGAPIVVTNAAGISGITTSTTNFDDGWVAQPFADYVKVTKQPVTVLLHYAFPIDDEMRYGDMISVAWNRLIVPRYRTSNVKVFHNDSFTYFKTYFMEGDAVELSTGKSCYVALRMLIANGITRCIEIIAPSMSAYQQEFPTQEKIEGMTGYNKFAVVAGDIGGTWEESTSAGIDMYNTVTGSYAGMNTSSSASSFTFKPDGSYDSTHKGAYGMVGSMKFYDQKYHGKYTLGSWDVTMTNRFEGKTDVYWCEYEAVRGGRVLKLRDKGANAMVYSLVRVR